MGRWILAIVAAAGCAFAYFGPGKGQASVGTPAPGFALGTSRGKVLSLSELRGKVVVLDFWATWCPPCRAAVPSMQRLHDQFSQRGVCVLGINVGETGDPIEFMRDMGANYTVLLHGEEVAREYAVKGIPTLLVINKEGEVVFRESGWSSAHEGKMAEIIAAELVK